MRAKKLLAITSHLEVFVNSISLCLALYHTAPVNMSEVGKEEEVGSLFKRCLNTRNKVHLGWIWLCFIDISSV